VACEIEWVGGALAERAELIRARKEEDRRSMGGGTPVGREEQGHCGDVCEGGHG